MEHEAIASFYESGFRGAAGHRGHGLDYDPATGRWVPAEDKVWGADELDAAIAERRPVLLEWLGTEDVERYLHDAGVDAARLDSLRRLLTA